MTCPLARVGPFITDDPPAALVWLVVIVVAVWVVVVAKAVRQLLNPNLRNEEWL